MEFSFRPRSIVGLEFSKTHLHLVHLQQQKQHYHLLTSVSRALPADIFAEGKMKNGALLSEILKEEVRHAGLSGLACALCLPVNLVRMQQIQLPHELSEKEIEEEIAARVHKDLPGMREALAIDFMPLTSQDVAYQHFFFVAARKSYLMQYEQAVNQAGLRTKIIEVDVFALIRLVRKTLAASSQIKNLQVIVHITHFTVLLIVCRAGEMIFHQRFQLADNGEAFQQLKNKMEVCAALLGQAERVQCILCNNNSEFKENLEFAFPEWEIVCLDIFKIVKLKTEVANSRFGDWMPAFAGMTSSPRDSVIPNSQQDSTIPINSVISNFQRDSAISTNSVISNFQRDSAISTNSVISNFQRDSAISTNSVMPAKAGIHPDYNALAIALGAAMREVPAW